jgi:hypothetical protein
MSRRQKRDGGANMTMSHTLRADGATRHAQAQPVPGIASEDYAASERTLAKAFRRILPFIFICYVISYLDRTNVGFSALTMNKDLGLTAEQFGFGAGLFFVGYFLFEIPSNLIMQKVGARVWIARIMITWGLFSMATAFVVGPKSFAAARFLLGLAEAGFTPGIYLYFTHWFPGKWRAKVTAAFLVGIPVANMIGSPVSGALLELGGLHGLRSWQWLLLIEGVPAVILGIACLFVLADRPEKAKWLSDEEKSSLAKRLALEQGDIGARHGSNLRDAMTNWRVFVLAFINFCGIVGSLGVGLWMPQNHQAVRRRARGRRLAHSDSVCNRRGSDALVGTRRQSLAEPHSVCGWRAGRGGPGAVREHFRRHARAQTDRTVLHGERHSGFPGDLLGHSIRIPHRASRCRRARAHRLGGQSRRLRWPVDDRRAQAGLRRLHRAAARGLGRAAARCADHRVARRPRRRRRRSAFGPQGVIHAFKTNP